MLKLKYNDKVRVKSTNFVTKIDQIDNSDTEFPYLAMNSDGYPEWFTPKELELVSPKLPSQILHEKTMSWKYSDPPKKVKSSKKSKYAPGNIDGFYDKYFNDGIEVTKKSTLYRLKDGKYKIFAEVTDNGITLKTMDDHDKFWFCNSQPELIKKIGNLLIRASELK